jgi:hypothetical protein
MLKQDAFVPAEREREDFLGIKSQAKALFSAGYKRPRGRKLV